MTAERVLRGQQQAARKKDAREKIQLGGLIVKAGLRFEKRAVVFGLLLEGKKRLNDPRERARLFDLGAAGLRTDGEAVGGGPATNDDGVVGGPGRAD